MPTQREIHILIADDHEIVRSGLKSLLTGTEIKVVAEAATGQAAVNLALEKELDLVLLDVRMPDGDGLSALARIKLEKPDMTVLLLSAFDNPASIARAVVLGASGFVSKGCSRDDLLKAIRIVTVGGSVWSKETLRSASGALRTRCVGTLEASLTEREGEVLRQTARGLTNQQIAMEMKISCVTVNSHVLRRYCARSV